jgi:DegV family protein with EDD domain
MAAASFEGRVGVVDSQTASMAEGFAAIEAARAAADGRTLEDVAERARRVAAASRLYATLDTFEYLRRSGRVSFMQASAASVLDIKPVFGFVGGEVSAVARTRTKRRALARIEEEVVASAAGRQVHLAVIHAAAPDEADRLAAAISTRVEVAELILTEVTPAIGAHVGPGLVGAAFYVSGASG